MECDPRYGGLHYCTMFVVIVPKHVLLKSLRGCSNPTAREDDARSLPQQAVYPEKSEL